MKRLSPSDILSDKRDAMLYPSGILRLSGWFISAPPDSIALSQR